MTKNFKKLEKIVKIITKLGVFSDRLFERSHGGGGGGVHRDADGEGGGNCWVRGGGNSAEGAIVGGSSASH